MAAKKANLADATASDLVVDTGPQPENTPPPGGGRWRWDIAKPGWVDIDAADSAPDTQTIQLSE